MGLLGMRVGCKLAMATTLLAVATLSASAADMAILSNGFAIRCARREASDQTTRLYLAETPDSYIDVPTAEIVGFEDDGLILPPTAPSTLPAKIVPAPAGNLDKVIRAASSRYDLDPDLINSVIFAESRFNPNAVSLKGAQGLMQLMPQTAARLGVRNAMDPAANIEGGTRYLRELLERYNNDLILTLAAYNAGPEHIEQYHGVPPYPETIAYVTRIIRDFNRKKLAQQRQQ